MTLNRNQKGTKEAVKKNENKRLKKQGNQPATPPVANNGADYITTDIGMCSGYGLSHTNNPNAKVQPRDYVIITYAQIQQRVDNPPSVHKNDAQWVIPSYWLSRDKADQRANGSYYLLWADLDKKCKPLGDIEKTVLGILGFTCLYEIYTSRRATEDNQKCRILIPLAKPLDGNTWLLCQEILNDKLQNSGITPDEVNETHNQICYLPNKGKFYDVRSNRAGFSFDAGIE